jgi:hypothetical protein
VEVQELMSEVQNSELVVESVSSLVEEVSKSFSALFDVFHVSILETSRKDYMLIQLVLQIFYLFFQYFISCNQSFSFFMQDFRTLIYQSSQQQNLTVSNYEKLTCHLRERVSELENEKVLLFV